MNKLKIVDAYDISNSNKIDWFKDNIRSTLQVDSLFDEVETDFEWLDLMEDTTRYIDNILRNPNRFIINEDEIVKVELAKRITVESIKHLARHTNFIQEINENDEVRPSKVLNINKEESFDTYENRVIYTLICRMRDFIEIKKKESITPYLKDNKKMAYHAKSTIGKEKININLEIESKIDTIKTTGESDGLSVEDRISKLEKDISIFLNSEVCLSLSKKHIALVIPPIKKTNVILKNVNFQYAMKLWDYLQNNFDTKSKRKKEKQNYEDEGVLKEYINETFILNYIALSKVHESGNPYEREEVVEELTNNLISRIVELNASLPEEKLKEILGDKIIVAKNKRKASLSEIQETISKQIKIYLDKIENHEMERIQNE